ncbi:type I restriction enzyme, S subunit [Tenacibaculum sp. MAR_2009_124]|uniref:restriction endonuclease subunit S n=1 Tax=Tenacibaculum sp. MAR_2009_124 TaxID=1250059 RepID=UPI0008962577|nr:restriction endonuclease subunit S [Tenacibaculum sp. MAR_2009_124]SEB35674.1 type I restriction enzyme, S subunit [Tenacibaculum sp. MAR_2009_124]
MNNEYNVYRLGEVVKIIAGGDKPKIFSEEKNDSNIIPVFANAEKKNGLSGYTNSPRIVESAVTVAARGSNVGFVAIRKEPFFPIVRLLTLIPDRELLDVDYLFYNLKQNRQNGTGSGQPQITIPQISDRTISLPSLITQQKAAKTLARLDAKIEINNKINQELEAMAKLLYDYWFVQFDFPNAEGKPYKTSGGKMVYNEALKREIPEGWEDGTILDCANLLGGGTPSKKIKEYWNGTIPFFTPSDTENNVFCLNTILQTNLLGVKKSSTKLLDKGTVLITARGTVGKINITGGVMAMNQSCYALTPKTNFESEFLYFHTLQMVKYLRAKSSGSIFKAIVTNDFKLTPIVIPNEEIVKTYSEKIMPMFNQILIKKKENQKLAELHDWLLPMLMNGQVTVGNDTETDSNLGMVAEEEMKYGKE